MTNLVVTSSSWLIYSSIFLLLALPLMLLIRSTLITFNYSRVTVLKLWLAIPLGLIVSFLAMNLAIQNVYLSPVIIIVPSDVELLTELKPDLNWPQLLMSAWLLIVGWKLTKLLRQYSSTKQKLCSHINQVGKDIYHSEMDISPVAFGIFNPVIILPKYLFHELHHEDIELVTMHERIHCKRKDPFWRFSFELLRCMYWFIPLKTMVKTKLIEDQEISCDEEVIRQSKKVTQYAQLLLRLNTHDRTLNHSSLLCSSSFNLKERIMKLNQKKTNRNQGSIIIMFFAIICAIGTVSALPQLSEGEVPKLIPIIQTAPMYPREAFQEKITGEVSVEFVVTKDGLVKNAVIVASNPKDIFDKAALQAVNQWRFDPIVKATKTSQTLKFNLD